jgi:tRNA1Val (adenine37-N6)-methyltransferase
VGTFCDLGAGVGVIGLALAAADPRATGVLVELQPRLAALAERNVALAEAGARLRVVTADLRALGRGLAADSCDLVVANPPYRPAGSGRLNPDREKALANLELECRLEDVVAQARRLLKPRARFALVHDATRLGEILAALAAAGLGAEVLRLVHPRADAPATRALVLARRLQRRPPLKVEPPLVLHEPDGRFTREAARILGEPG